MGEYLLHINATQTRGNSLKKNLTLVHPFFEEPKRFELQFNNWKNFSDKVKRNINIILVDDGSTPPATSFITPSKKKRIDFNLDIYRVKKNLKWNTPGALNLGIRQAKTDWIMVMDSDCMLHSDAIEHLINKMKPHKKMFYLFNRKRVTNKRDGSEKHTRFLPCTILFHKDAFHDVGGFDEDLSGEWSGGYGYFDNDFVTRLKDKYVQTLIEDVIVHEYMDDIVGANIQEKTNVNPSTHHRINKKIWYDKMNGVKPRNIKHLNFEWEHAASYIRGKNDLR